MKTKIAILFVAIFFIFAGNFSAKIPKTLNENLHLVKVFSPLKGEKVDSFKVISEGGGDTSRECSVTIQYYFDGEPVGSPVTYTGTTCFEWNTCSGWRRMMVNYITDYIDDNHTMAPVIHSNC